MITTDPGNSESLKPVDWRPILVTLGALLAYKIGAHIPVPGLDAGMLQSLNGPHGFGFAIERVSIMSLGVIPWFSALMLAELATLLIPALHRWRQTPNGAAAIYRAMLGLGFAFAALQALGIATALQEMPRLVTEPGPRFLWLAGLSILGGAAVAIWLAALITRHGIGHGLWIMLAAPAIMGLPSFLASFWQLVRNGEVSEVGAAVPVLATLACAAAVVALLSLRRQAGFPGIDDVIWPVMLGAALAGWVAGLSTLLLDPPAGAAAAAWLAPGRPIWLAVLALSTALFVWRYAALNPGVPARATALVLVAVMVLPEAILAPLNLPVLLDSRWIVIAVAVLFSFVQMWQTRASRINGVT